MAKAPMTPLDPSGIKAPGATMSGMGEQPTVQWVLNDNPPPVEMPGRAPRLLPGQIVDYDDITYEVISRTEHQGGRISYDLRALPERVPGATKWSPLGEADER